MYETNGDARTEQYSMMPPIEVQYVELYAQTLCPTHIFFGYEMWGARYVLAACHQHAGPK